VRGKGQAKNSDKIFWERRKFMQPMGRPIFFLLSLGGWGFRGGYFSGFPGSIMLTIPHHPLTLIGALKGKGGGGPSQS